MPVTHLKALALVAPSDARAKILTALAASDGNLVHAAGVLDVKLRTLRRICDELKLWPEIDRRWERHPGPPRKSAS